MAAAHSGHTGREYVGKVPCESTSALFSSLLSLFSRSRPSCAPLVCFSFPNPPDMSFSSSSSKSSRAEQNAWLAKKRAELGLAPLSPRPPVSSLSVSVSGPGLSVEATMSFKAESAAEGSVSRSSDVASKRSHAADDDDVKIIWVKRRSQSPEYDLSDTDTEEEGAPCAAPAASDEPPAKVARLAPAAVAVAVAPAPAPAPAPVAAPAPAPAAPVAKAPAAPAPVARLAAAVAAVAEAKVHLAVFPELTFLAGMPLSSLPCPKPSKRRVVFVHSAHDFVIRRGSPIAYVLNEEDRTVASFDGHIGFGVVEMAFTYTNASVLVRIYKPGKDANTWARTPYCRLLSCVDIIDTIRPDSTFNTLKKLCEQSVRTFGVVVTPDAQGPSVPAPFANGDTISVKPKPGYMMFHGTPWYGRVLASFKNPMGIDCYAMRWYTKAKNLPGSFTLTDQVGDAPTELGIRKFAIAGSVFNPANF